MPEEYEFPNDDGEAATRAAEFREEDPFPSIPRALLSSAEIYDYVKVTGMLHPFFPNDLKSASYEAHLGGRFIMWNETGKRIDKVINRGDLCTLPANSIAFVQVEPRFRLPYYIALRFNLRITHVHRGLLLGTGPLVDPGFDGQLLIPLHNLTSSDYEIDTTKALIWIEFTKTSFGFQPTEDAATYPRKHFEFEPEKTNLTPETYLQKASGGHEIRSSIPDIIEQSSKAALQAVQSAAEAATSAQNAETNAEKARRTLRNIAIGAGVAIVIALVAIVFQVYGLVQDSHSMAASVTKELKDVDATTKMLQAEVRHLRNEVDAARDSDATTKTDIDVLRQRLLTLKAEIIRLIKSATESQQSQQQPQP